MYTSYLHELVSKIFLQFVLACVMWKGPEQSYQKKDWRITCPFFWYDTDFLDFFLEKSFSSSRTKTIMDLFA